MTTKNSKKPAKAPDKGTISNDSRDNSKSKEVGKKELKSDLSRTARTIKKKETFLEALRAHAGNITTACEAANIGRRTVYDWRSNDPDFQRAVEDVTESVYDFVESKIMEQIGEGNTAVLIFFAKTKMKARGYIERQEISVSDAPAFVVEGDTKAAGKVMELIKKNNKKAV
jgi:hypothetical protein